MAALPASDPGACERCGATAWRFERPALVAGTTRWLRTGEPWRPARPVCGSCGAAGPRVAWLVRWDDEERSRLTLPARVLRGLLRTITQERRSEPAPWLYLASTAVGALVGVTAAVVSRSGRPWLAGAVGASSGGVTCWSVFAATALRSPSLGFELRVAALQQLAPERAAGLRADRDHAVARSASFSPYGLAHWDGPRLLAGYSGGGSPPRATSVALGHGDLSDRAGTWLVVETAERERSEQHSRRMLADALWDEASGAHDTDPSDMDDAALLAHVHAVQRARAARPEPTWHDSTVLVDGQRVPVSWAGEKEHWVAHALVGDLSVALRAHRLPLEDVSLVAFRDLSAYARWSG